MQLTMEHALIVSLAALALVAGANLVALRVPISGTSLSRPALVSHSRSSLASLQFTSTQISCCWESCRRSSMPPPSRLPWEEFDATYVRSRC